MGDSTRHCEGRIEGITILMGKKMKYPDDFVNKIICGDCLEVMKSIPNNKIDLIVTDPPYNISNYSASITKRGSKIVQADFGEWDKWNTLEEYFKWCVKLVKEMDRVLKQQGSLYCFWDNHYQGHITYLIEKNTNLQQKCPIILKKINPIPHVRKTNFRSSFELLTLYVKDPNKKPKTFNFLSQKDMCNVMDYAIGKKHTAHPTEKPLEIIRKFVKISSNKNDLVLDPFMGGGTTAVACKELGREFIGVEISPKYVKMTKERLKRVIGTKSNLERFV